MDEITREMWMPLVEQCEQYGITLSENQVQQFHDFYEMLIEKNKVMNLTAITRQEEVMEKHFLDSLTLSLILPLKGNEKILDLGTGAGFPGIPLNIWQPSVRMTLTDSLQKRISFLDEVIEKLQLPNTQTVHGRAEDLAHQAKYREAYDLCISRAVAALPVLCEYCLPFVKEGGVFVAYKSGNVEEELVSAKKALSILGGSVKEVKSFSIGQENMARTLICIEKVKKTPGKYPRKAGTPSRQPLG